MTLAKGKIEAAIKYVRRNFWPLRFFKDLFDVQAQGRQWLNTVANVRVHQTTGQRPDERFDGVKLNPLPDFLPDCREVYLLKVHKDFAVRFDGNTYTTPPWTIGKKLTVKADTATVTIYNGSKKVVAHQRCWQRHCRIENKAHKEQVQKMRKRLWQDRQIAAFASLGADARLYLQGLIEAVTKQTPVGETCQRVVVGKFLQLIFCLFTLRNILNRTREPDRFAAIGPPIHRTKSIANSVKVPKNHTKPPRGC